MPLELGELGRQLSEGIRRLQAEALPRLGERRRRARELLAQANAELAHWRELTQGLAGRTTWLAGVPVGPVLPPEPPPPVPADYLAVGVDGSQIQPDRHLPVWSYLINVGVALVRYGASPEARLFSEPSWHYLPEELVLTDPADSARQVRVEGALLAARRFIRELGKGVELAERTPADLPVLVLLDGSLVMWGLAGRRVEGFVREQLIGRELLPLFNRLHRLVDAGRQVVVAGYISGPQSAEVVNALRLFICPFDPTGCAAYCPSRSAFDGRACDEVGGVLDADLFRSHLGPGERTGLFESQSSVVRELYGPYRVGFFYLNAGPEIARVEVPWFVAENPDLLGLCHGLVWDQVQKGSGYPAVLSEAHEQAVVRGTDRELFRTMLLDALARLGLPEAESAKAVTKRRRPL